MSYRRKNTEFNQRLAYRRDTLLLAQLGALLDACNVIMHTQESEQEPEIVYDEVTGSELFRFEHDGREPEYDADLECE